MEQLVNEHNENHVDDLYIMAILQSTVEYLASTIKNHFHQTKYTSARKQSTPDLPPHANAAVRTETNLD